MVARARVLVTEYSPRLEVARPGAPLLIIVVPPVPPRPQQAGGVVPATDRIRGVMGSGCAGGAIRRARGARGERAAAGRRVRGEKGPTREGSCRPAARAHPHHRARSVAPVYDTLTTRADFLPASALLCPSACSLVPSLSSLAPSLSRLLADTSGRLPPACTPLPAFPRPTSTVLVQLAIVSLLAPLYP